MSDIPAEVLGEEIAASRRKLADLGARHDHVRKTLDTLAGLQEQFDAMADRSGFVRVGDPVDWRLPDAHGVERSFRDLAPGPAVLVFYRGGWCPYCNMTLRAYQTHLMPRLGAFGATMIAISPQLPEESLATAEAGDLEFAVVSDVGNLLARRLGLAFEVPGLYLEHMLELGRDLRVVNGSGDGAVELVMPAVVVTDDAGIVRYVDVHPRYVTRTEPAAILEVLRGLGVGA